MADVKIPKEGSIPMLKPSNYQEWKDAVVAWFKLSHCHKIINGTTPKPSRTSQELAQEGVPEALAKEVADWEKLDESGQGLIEYFTAPEYRSIYKELEDTTANPITAKRMWDQATLKFGKPNVFNGLTLWEKLIAFKFDYDKPLSGQITEYRRLREQCKEAGIVITDYLFALTFLTHLPSQYKSTVISIMESKKPSASLDTTGLEDIFQTVMTHEDFLKGGKKDKPSSSNIASVRTPENKKWCEHHQSSGHWTKDCRNPNSGNSNNGKKGNNKNKKNQKTSGSGNNNKGQKNDSGGGKEKSKKKSKTSKDKGKGKADADIQNILLDDDPLPSTLDPVEITISMFNVTGRTLSIITFAYLISMEITQFRCHTLQLRIHCSG
jgi:hypothetical protein